MVHNWQLYDCLEEAAGYNYTVLQKLKCPEFSLPIGHHSKELIYPNLLNPPKNKLTKMALGRCCYCSPFER